LDGNLSSLRDLHLAGVVTTLPWRNLSNLTTFRFFGVPGYGVTVTQLLDFFEDAPHLREINLRVALAETSQAPPERMVHLPRLRTLRITDHTAPSILLNHLHVPIGVLMKLWFEAPGDVHPMLDLLPMPLDNLSNISHITSINLEFFPRSGMRLNGTSVELYMQSTCNGEGPVGRQNLRSLNQFRISATERFTLSQHCDISSLSEIEKSGAYQTLLLMNHLHTLTLMGCNNLPFIFALSPDRNPLNAVVCPELEGFILYIWEVFDRDLISDLAEMARARVSSGAKLSTIVTVCLSAPVSLKKLPLLRSYVSHVEHRATNKSPRWYAIPGEVGDIEDFEDFEW